LLPSIPLTYDRARPAGQEKKRRAQRSPGSARWRHPETVGGARQMERSSDLRRCLCFGGLGYLVEKQNFGFRMNNTYEHVSRRFSSRWAGLALFGVLFALSPGWQSAGTGQNPAAIPAGDPSRSFSGGLSAAHEAGQFPLAGGAAAGDCLGFVRPANDGGQIITLINTAREWMAVYHVDGPGKIHLIGSRPLQQDFAVQFNAVAPLPEEMRRIATPK